MSMGTIHLGISTALYKEQNVQVILYNIEFLWPHLYNACLLLTNRQQIGDNATDGPVMAFPHDQSGEPEIKNWPY
jgi:hypothetical protein